MIDIVFKLLGSIGSFLKPFIAPILMYFNGKKVGALKEETRYEKLINDENTKVNTVVKKVEDIGKKPLMTKDEIIRELESDDTK